MAAFDISGKVGLDVGGFYRGVGKMVAGAEPLGRDIGKKLGEQIVRFVGIGALAGTIKNVVFGAIQKAARIKLGADQVDIDTSTFQVLERVAERSGMSVSEIVEGMQEATVQGDALRESVAAAVAELKNAGQVLNQDVVANLAKAQEEMENVERAGTVFVSNLSRTFKPLAEMLDIFHFYTGRGQVMRQMAMGATLVSGVLGKKTVASGVSAASDFISGGSTDGPTYGPKTRFESLVDELRNRQKDKRESKYTAPSDSAPFKDSRYSAGMAEYGGSNVSTGVESQLKLLNRTVSDLNAKISTLKLQ